MDVEPQRTLEQGFRDQRAVGCEHDDVLARIEVRERFRLAHLDPQLLRRLLGRRRPQVAAPSARPVRPRQQVGDVVLRGQTLEHVRAERRGRRNRKPQLVPY